MIVHIAGLDIRVGDQLRQRCGWCGTVLIDEDLSRIGVQIGPDGTAPPLPTWPVGALIEIDGAMSSVVPHEDGARLPESCCAQMPHDLTGAPA